MASPLGAAAPLRYVPYPSRAPFVNPNRDTIFRFVSAIATRGGDVGTPFDEKLACGTFSR